MSILKTKQKLRTIDLFKHIFIDANFTMAQRTQYKDIKCQLNEKKRLSDNGWFIKFVNDVPTLVEKTSKCSCALAAT